MGLCCGGGDANQSSWLGGCRPHSSYVTPRLLQPPASFPRRCRHSNAHRRRSAASTATREYQSYLRRDACNIIIFSYTPGSKETRG